MKNYKIIEIMEDFSILINESIKPINIEEAKKVNEDIKNDIDKYLYAVVEEE